MKKPILIALAAASLTAVAAPALAQPRYDDRRYEDRYDRRDENRRYDDRRYDDRRYEDSYDWNRRMDASDRLQRRIDRAAQSGRLSPNEARNLRNQVRDIERIERNYWRDGRLSDWERRDLQHRVQIAEQWFRYERRDRDYGSGYGYRR